jgi:hypothetical protein
MDEIAFTADGITLKESITVLGETRIEEKTIGYEDRDEYEMDLDTGGFVSLDDLIEIQHNQDGGIEALHMTLKQVPSIEAEIRTLDNGGSSDEPPEVPRVDIDSIEIESRKNFYRRLRDQPESQPAVIRRVIYAEGELIRRELNQLIEDAGYASSGGGVSQSLVVLEKVTGEIERHGQGDDQRIVWIGEE